MLAIPVALLKMGLLSVLFEVDATEEDLVEVLATEVLHDEEVDMLLVLTELLLLLVERSKSISQSSSSSNSKSDGSRPHRELAMSQRLNSSAARSLP